MANGSKLLSGRVLVTPYSDLSNSRHEFLGLNQAEPNLGTGSDGSILTISTNNQRVFSDAITVSNLTGDVTIAAGLTANSLTIGSGIFQFSKISMYHATTISSSTQEILSLGAEGLAGVDLVIISTDAISSSRQITKLSIVIYDGIISYNDTSTLAVNNYLCEFSVNYDAEEDKLQVTSTPSTSNFMNHKMQIIAYAE